MKDHIEINRVVENFIQDSIKEHDTREKKTTLEISKITSLEYLRDPQKFVKTYVNELNPRG